MPLYPAAASIYYNLKDYGASGDGSDATTAWNAVLLALGTKSGTIVVPDGTYGISSRITYAFAANQHIVIEGQGNARLVSTVAEPGSEAGIFTFTGDSGVTAKLTIRRLKISHTNSGLGILDGLYVQPLNYGSGGTQSLASVLFEDVTITGMSRWGANIIGAKAVQVTKCSMSSNRDAGLNMIGGTDIVVSGGDYSSNVTGALSGDYGITLASSSLIPPCKNVLILGVQANNNGRKGIDCHHGHNVHIIGNSCVGNGYCGIYAVMESSSKDVGDVTIIGNTIDQTGGDSSQTATPIEIGTFGTTGALNAGSFIVSGNKIYGVDTGAANSHAIRLHTATSGVAPERVVISNNTVEHGAGSTGYFLFQESGVSIAHLVITGNVFHTTSCAHGIIVNSVTDAIIASNTLKVDSGTPTTGINIPAATNALIIGNQVNASPTTVISNQSSGTHLHRNNQQNGVELASTSYPLPFTVAGGLTVDASGHLLSLVAGTPTLTSVNANVISQVVAGNDVRGTITFNVQTGTIVTGTALFTVNFAIAYASAPVVVLTNASNQTTGGWYVQSVGTSTFVVRNAAAVAVLSGYIIDYVVIG